MMFVLESPIRNAACVSSGEYPNCINIGTKIGPSNAHLADAEPISRFTTAVNPMIPRIVTPPGNPKCSNPRAPFTAINAPKFESRNAAVNCAAQNAITR